MLITSSINHFELDKKIVRNLFRQHQLPTDMSNELNKLFGLRNEVNPGDDVEYDNYLVDIGKLFY